MAAKRTSANADATENFRLITHTDLPKLDTRAKFAGQILDQITEINTSLGGKIKEKLVVIKRIFRLYQLHLQPMFLDFFLANKVRLALAKTVVAFCLLILLRCNAQHFLKRQHHFLIRHCFRWKNHRSVLYAACRLHNDMHASLQGKILGIEIIYFARLSKADTDYICHVKFSFMLSKSSSVTNASLMFRRMRTFAVSMARKVCCSPA